MKTRALSRLSMLCLGLILGGCSFTPPDAKTNETRARALDLVEEGQKLEKSGQFEQAAQRYLQARDLYATPQVYHRLGHVNYQMGELETARQYLQRSVEMGPQNSPAFYELVHVEGALKAKGATATTQPAGQSARVEPQAPPAAKAPAQLSFNPQPMNQTPAPVPQASAQLPSTETAAQKDARVKSEGVRLSDVNRVLFGDGVDAQAVPVGKAGPTFIADAEFHAKKAREYAQSGRTDLAVEEFEEALKREPSNSGYRVELSKVLRQLGDEEEARRELVKALQVNPRDAEALMLLSEVKLPGENTSEAQALLEQASRAGSSDAETQIVLGDLYMSRGQQEKASEHFQRAHQLRPNDPKPLWKLGNVRREVNDAAQAKRFYEEALKRDPKYVPALNNLAFMADEAGQYDQSRQYLERVLAVDPSWAKAYFNLGVLHEIRFNNPAKAVEYYQKYLQVGDQLVSQGKLSREEFGRLADKARANVKALRGAGQQ